uniref:R-spondin 3 n=1 Tax=Sparus aurata TaxID=8175 RepID=A0A671WYK1_SPAAU
MECTWDFSFKKTLGSTLHSSALSHQTEVSTWAHLNELCSSSAGRPCPAGCATCSALNGCLSCKPRLFFHLELDGMRQRGTCLSSCPRGHYGTRSQHISTCTKCSTGCEVCVRRNMCVRCRADLYHLHGLCHPSCPRGFEPDVQLMQCLPQVHCEVGEWTDWGPCVRRRSMRAYRRGEETRTRRVLQSPSASGDPCPHVSEIRKCVIKKRPKIIASQDTRWNRSTMLLITPVHNTYIKNITEQKCTV